MKVFASVCLCLALLLCLCPVAGAVDPAWVHALRRLLPPFQLRPVPAIVAKGGGGQLSPDGRWIVEAYWHPVHLDAGGEEPQSLRLYDRMGRFVRDLTYPRFYIIDRFVWEPSKSGGLIFTSSDHPWRGFNKESGTWRCDLPTGRVSPYRGPDVVFTSEPLDTNSQQSFKQWSPDGESYLATLPTGSSINAKPTLSLENTVADVILYCVQTRSGSRRKLAEGSLGGGCYSPDGQRVLLGKEALKPSPQTDALVINELWSVQADGAGAVPLIAEAQERRLAAQRHWRNPIVSGVMGWCGERSVLASGSFETEQDGLVAGTWVSHSGRQPSFVPGVELVSASQGGRSFLIRDNRNGTYLLTLRSIHKRHTAKLQPSLDWKVDDAVMKAASDGNVVTLRSLLSRGARVNFISMSTPLVEAAGGGHLETVKLLLAHGADANGANNIGFTALDEVRIALTRTRDPVMRRKYAEIVTLLKKAGALKDGTDKTAKQGRVIPPRWAATWTWKNYYSAPSRVAVTPHTLVLQSPSPGKPWRRTGRPGRLNGERRSRMPRRAAVNRPTCL